MLLITKRTENKIVLQDGNHTLALDARGCDLRHGHDFVLELGDADAVKAFVEAAYDGLVRISSWEKATCGDMDALEIVESLEAALAKVKITS